MLSYRTLVKLALISVGFGKRILGVDRYGTFDHANESMETMSDDDVNESLEAMNGTRARGLFDTILLRPCIADLAHRYEDFFKYNGLDTIKTTRNVVKAPSFHGLGGWEKDIGKSVLQPIEGQDFQTALANVWEGVDHPKPVGYSRATFSADTIKSFGFSLDGATEMCQHQIEQPAMDELMQCVQNAIECRRENSELECSMDSYIQSWGKWTKQKNFVSEKWRGLKASLPGAVKDKLQLKSSRERVLVRIDGKTLRNSEWGERIGAAREDGTKSLMRSTRIKNILENIRDVGKNPTLGVRQLVNFALGQKYNLKMLRSVTTRSFRLNGTQKAEAGLKTVSELITMEEKWLFVAKGMLEEMFQFSIDAAEELCAMREEGNTPIAIGQKIMDEWEKSVAFKGSTCAERSTPEEASSVPYPYCPEGHGPQMAGIEGASRGGVKAAVAWNVPSIAGHNLCFLDPFLGAPVFSAGGAMIVWTTAIATTAVKEAFKCSCIVRECKRSEDDKCVMDAAESSANPYNWLPFPGTKCVAGKGTRSQCRLEPCNSQDYQKRIAGQATLKGTIGRETVDGIVGHDLHNCLSVDGTISGSIFQRTHHFGTESATDGTKPDEGMNIRSRCKLYKHLGLPPRGNC